MSLRSSATHIVIFDFYRGKRIGGYYGLPSSSPRTCSMRKQPLFRDATAKWRLRNERRNSILMTQHYPDLGNVSYWQKVCFNQSEALTRSGKWRVISMEFLLSFLRRHFAEKPVVASQNSGRVFLRLSNLELARRWNVMGLMVWVTAALPCEIKFFSNFDRNSKYNKSSEVRASSPTTAFMACTSLPMA